MGVARQRQEVEPILEGCGAGCKDPSCLKKPPRVLPNQGPEEAQKDSATDNVSGVKTPQLESEDVVSSL